jgi:hypothetical protein
MGIIALNHAHDMHAVELLSQGVVLAHARTHSHRPTFGAHTATNTP